MKIEAGITIKQFYGTPTKSQQQKGTQKTIAYYKTAHSQIGGLPKHAKWSGHRIVCQYEQKKVTNNFSQKILTFIINFFLSIIISIKLYYTCYKLHMSSYTMKTLKK